MPTIFNILLLEDDAVLSKEIARYLTTKDFVCEQVFDGDLFVRHSKNKHYDLYLLDINVPKINGLDICKMIREKDKTTPILFITAYGDIQDKIDAFKLGADDYLVKPFHLDELYFRVLALMRRSSTPQQTDDILQIEDLEINTTSMMVKRKGEMVELTPKEYQLLLALARANGRVLSKQAISEQVWDIHFDTNLNTIEVYINFLRKKIDKNHDIKLIHTRPGFGYYLKHED